MECAQVSGGEARCRLEFAGSADRIRMRAEDGLLECAMGDRRRLRIGFLETRGELRLLARQHGLGKRRCLEDAREHVEGLLALVLARQCAQLVAGAVGVEARPEVRADIGEAGGDLGLVESAGTLLHQAERHAGEPGAGRFVAAVAGGEVDGHVEHRQRAVLDEQDARAVGEAPRLDRQRRVRDGRSEQDNDGDEGMEQLVHGVGGSHRAVAALAARALAIDCGSSTATVRPSSTR